MKRITLAAAILGTAATAAIAQPARAPAAKPQTAQPQQPAPPPIFPCRTEAETCFLGVVIGSQVAVIYTNVQKAEGLDAKPVDLLGQDGAKVDLAQNAGRVVMIAGSYDPNTGIKGELVEVASPLASLVVKAQLGGGDAPPPAPQASSKRR